MREIKFRAFDRRQEKYLWPYPEGFALLGEVSCFDLIGQQLREATPYEPTLSRIGDIEIMQYTGLKDKNGKQIYEGDVVKHAIYGHGIKPTVINYIIRWYVTGWRWQRIVSKDKLKKAYDGTPIPPTPIIVALRDFQSCEVIGNIYENPELLTNQQ